MAYNYQSARQIVNNSTTYQSYSNPTSGSYAASGWITKTSDTTSTNFSGLTKLGLSSNGVYQLAISSTANTLYLSMNNGVTWTNIYARSGLPGSGSFSTGSISADGKYILVGVSGGYMYLSRDSGLTFANVNTNTPVVYLPFETTPVNGAIGGTTLTVTGSPTLTQGIVGANAVNFTQSPGVVSTQYIRGTLSSYANYTVSFWFNIQQVLAGKTSIMYTTGTTSAGSQNFYIYHNGSQILVGGNPTATLTVPQYITLNTWYNIMVIYQSASTCSVYLNNIFIGSVTAGTAVTTTTTFALGAYTGYAGVVNTDPCSFNGYIDDLKIYGSAIGFTPMVPMNYSYSAVSGTGQYMACAVASGGLFLSSNYGSTWSQVTSVIGTGAWSSLALSHTGQYMLANGGGMTSPNSLLATSNTWTVNGVTWTASQSSAANTGSYVGYYAFNTLLSAPDWACVNNGAYTSATPGVPSGATTVSNVTGLVSGTTVQGEWLQIQSSVPLTMYSYICTSGGTASYAPRTYNILGSVDGTNWYNLQSASLSTNPTTTNSSSYSPAIIVNSNSAQTIVGQVSAVATTVATSYAVNAYTYFRIVVTSIFTGPTAEIGEWFINFVGGQSYSTNYGGTWTNSLNTYVPNMTGLTGSTSVSNATTSWQTPNGVTWTSSASGALTATYNAWIAFNNIYNTSTSPYSWASLGNYNSSGTTNTTTNIIVGIGSVYGEWLQIQSSIPLSMYSYAFAAGGGINNMPKIYYIVGSNDGSNWYPIQYVSIGTNPCTTTYNSRTTFVTVNQSGTQTITADVSSTFTINTYSTTTNLYTYFRLIVNTTFGTAPSCTELNEWYINFVGGTSTQINSTIATPNCLALSANGQYAIGANLQTASLISNYLGGFATNSSTALTLSGINANIVAAACSNTGAIMVLITSSTTNNVYYSLNYGSTWSALTIGTVALTGCAVNYDGSYITVSNATNIYTLNTNTISNSVALGVNAGQTNQGSNTIAIGSSAGQTNQTANSIILNASGSALNSYTSGFYVAPIANALASTSQQFCLLGYGADNQVVQSGLSFSTTPQTFYGEWIQLQLATAVSITSYSLQGRLTLQFRFPGAFVLVGSNDATYWTILDTQVGAAIGTYTLKSASAVYSYFRVIFTQSSSAAVYGLVDIGGFILYNNSNSIFGPNANYTIAASGLYNQLQLNSVTVCTVTFSWPNIGNASTAYANSFGIYADNVAGVNQPIALLPTTDGYLKSSDYMAGFGVVNGPTYEYNSSYVAIQGTSTVANSSVLNGNVQVSGTYSSYTSGLLNITNTNTNPIVSFSVLGPNALNANVSMLIGQSATQYNSFYLSYTHVSGGSTYNYLGISPYGNGSLGLNIAASGNVGIGITNPAYALDVNGSAHLSSTLYVANPTATTSNTILFGQSITVTNTTASGTYEGTYQYISANSATLGSFNNSYTQVYKGNALWIQAGSMSSNQYFNGNISSQGGTLYLCGGNGPFASSTNNGAGTTHQYGGDVVIQGGYTNIGGPGQYDVRSGNIYFRYQTSNLANNAGFNPVTDASYSTAMFINGSNGAVGIGITNPAYTLDVNGTMRAGAYIPIVTATASVPMWYSNTPFTNNIWNGPNGTSSMYLVYACARTGGVSNGIAYVVPANQSIMSVSLVQVLFSFSGTTLSCAVSSQYTVGIYLPYSFAVYALF